MTNGQSNRDMSSHILPSSATMVGVCITVIGLVRLVEAHTAVAMVIDNIVAVDSLLFLLAALLSYLSLRSALGAARLERYADLVFMAGLVLLVVSSFMLAWEVGQVEYPGARPPARSLPAP